MTPRPLSIGDRVMWLERMMAGRIRTIRDDRLEVMLEVGIIRVIFCDDLVPLAPLPAAVIRSHGATP